MSSPYSCPFCGDFFDTSIEQEDHVFTFHSGEVYDYIGDIINNADTSVDNISTATSTILEGIWTGLTEFIPDLLEGVTSNIDEIGSTILDVLSPVISDLDLSLQSYAQGISDNAELLIQSLASSLTEGYRDFVDFYVDEINSIGTDFASTITELATFTEDIMPQIMELLDDDIAGLFSAWETILGDVFIMFDPLINSMAQSTAGILDILTTLFDPMELIINQFGERLVTGLTGLFTFDIADFAALQKEIFEEQKKAIRANVLTGVE